MSSRLNHIFARPGETLTHHVLEVVSRFDELEAGRNLPESSHLFDRLRLAAWLHDSGKLAKGFQRQLVQRDFRWGLRHEVLSLAFVKWLDCSEEDLFWVVLIIATHHRSLDLVLDTYRPGTGRAEMLIDDVDPAMFPTWYEWLGDQEVPLKPYDKPEAEDIDTQLQRLSAWQMTQPHPLHSSIQYIELLLAHGIFTQADHSAAAGLTIYPLAVPRLNALTQSYDLYSHQEQCIDFAGQSLVLTAPAGAGKTLAAMLWGKDIPQQVIYLLPYRASMNAMHRQLQTVFEHIGIQHGRALHVLYRQALEENMNEAEAVQVARFSLNMARLNAYPARVTSPHVLLRAMYGLTGFTATQAMLYGAAVIVDEIHAYRPERLAKILVMLAYFRQKLNVRLLLMTATLPGVMLTALTEVFGELPQVHADESIYQRFVRHRIQVKTGDMADNLSDIVLQAQRGQAVLITVNTVRRARTIARLIQESHHHDVLLLHGRFNGRDRWQHEQQILNTFSMGVQRDWNPIVVSTQVIEVSLNLDFDTVHSDPAPLDALLQRFGRVNRNGRLSELAPVHIYTQPDGKNERYSVYDPDLIERTLTLLQSHQGEPVDEAHIVDWLDAVYIDHEGWLETFRSSRREFEQAVLAELNPFEPAGRWMAVAFARLFDEVYVLPLDLEDEYTTLASENPIEASDLLVSISWWQYKMLERRGQAWQEDTLTYVDRPYDSELGLVIDEDNEE